MNTLEIKEVFVSKKIICRILGHKIIPTRRITEHIYEYKCCICDLELTNDDLGNKTDLTPKLKEINETLIQFYKKKFKKNKR